MRRAGAALAIAAAAAVVLSGCLGPRGRAGEPPLSEMEVVAASLPRAFDTLVTLRVHEFRQSDWCTYIAYERGLFSQNGDGSGCNLALMRLQQPEGILDLPVATYPAFDAQTIHDFELVSLALEETGVPVREVSTRYDGEGAIRRAMFTVEGGVDTWQYIYLPDYGDLPDDIPNEMRYTPIDGDWYFRWIEWM